MRMRRVCAVILAIGLGTVLGACGEADPENVVWSCTCTMADCDGTVEVVGPDDGCGKAGDKAKAESDYASGCQTGLSLLCTVASCTGCTCTESSTECTPT